jgi:hypothetical protein
MGSCCGVVHSCCLVGCVSLDLPRPDRTTARLRGAGNISDARVQLFIWVINGQLSVYDQLSVISYRRFRKLSGAIRGKNAVAVAVSVSSICAFGGKTLLTRISDRFPRALPRLRERENQQGVAPPVWRGRLAPWRLSQHVTKRQAVTCGAGESIPDETLRGAAQVLASAIVTAY